MSRVFFCRKLTFTAAHHYEIKDLGADANRAFFGDAAVPHAHDWVLTLWLEGPVNPRTGMIADLTAVDDVLRREVYEPFHQSHFNEVEPYFRDHRPTTEMLAVYFAQKLQPHLEPVKIARLRIAEADDLFAEWTP